jgi:4-amino-4-deoxy-L-arabinose transferase-like glycosyltransferase
MKRSLQILRAAVGILSLLLCLAIAIFWIRSYFIGDRFLTYETRDSDDSSSRPIISLDIGCGGLSFMYTSWHAAPSPFPNKRYVSSEYRTGQPEYPSREWQFARGRSPFGFAFHHHAGGSLSEMYQFSEFGVIAPFWSLFLLVLLFALPWLKHRYRIFRHPKPGHCPNCNYDLRASPAICPECGHSITNLTPTPP